MGEWFPAFSYEGCSAFISEGTYRPNDTASHPSENESWPILLPHSSVGKLQCSSNSSNQQVQQVKNISSMKCVKTKPLQELFWVKKQSTIKAVPTVSVASVTLTHPAGGSRPQNTPLAPAAPLKPWSLYQIQNDSILHNFFGGQKHVCHKVKVPCCTQDGLTRISSQV